MTTNPAYELMKAAYKRGVNFFDNAETYAAGEAERIMGEAIQIGITNGDWTREDLVVSTKIFFGTRSGPNNVGLSRKHIIEGVGERPRAGRPPPPRTHTQRDPSRSLSRTSLLGGRGRHAGVAEASAARLRRPDVLPPPGPADADRGDGARHELARRPGPRLLLGHQRMERCAADRGAASFSDRRMLEQNNNNNN